MAGINQGTPETAVGEPIRLGSNNEFEIEQHPASDRLIIRDTVNGKVAYVRKERGGTIGGDGVLIRALREGKPMADDGRTYDTIQEAERQASSWVFVPPGTFNENVTINTKGLTLRGSGYNTIIDGGTNIAVNISSNNVTVMNIQASNEGDGSDTTNTIEIFASGVCIQNIHIPLSGRSAIYISQGYKNNSIINTTVEESRLWGINVEGNRNIVSGCNVSNASTGDDDFGDCYRFGDGNENIIANCIANPGADTRFSINYDQSCNNNICIGNRSLDGADINEQISCENNIIANNRAQDIRVFGTGTLLDGNLTGASN